MNHDTARLGQAVKARREELDLTQLDVYYAGGPSNSTLTGLENGTAENVSRSTLRKLDAGLRWAPGTAKRIWVGEDVAPRPIEPIVTSDVERMRRLIESSDVSPELRQRLLDALPGGGDGHGEAAPTSDVTRRAEGA